ncbi:MAG: hypothetical protein O2856_04005 [Planctomycetota bacterium]|nr:hypothetical protein [Planctomycetota bacterium]
MKPSEGLPECECGDRVVGIVRYSVPHNDGFGPMPTHGRIQPHVIVFVATEDGFQDVEDVCLSICPSGFDIHDCELWMLESDLIKEAENDTNR